MKELIKIEFIRMYRKKIALIMNIGFPIIFYLIFSTMVRDPNPVVQQQINSNILGSMTAYSLTSYAFFSLPISLVEDQENGWAQVLDRTPLSKFQAYLAKTIRMLFLIVLSTILVFCVGYFIKGVEHTLIQWVISALLLILGGSIFLCISPLFTFFKDSQTTSIVGNICFIALALLGGLWFPLSSFPEWLQKIGRWTPTYHLNNLSQQYLQKDSISYQSFLSLIIYGVIFMLIAKLISLRKISSYR